MVNEKSFALSLRSCWVFLLSGMLSFPAMAQYVINGNAVSLGSTCFRLTPAALNQHGSVWFQNKLNLNFDFEISADLNFGNIDAGGADGMAFVLQPICTGLGDAGEGIGYFGINPSLAVEYDTWQNTNRHDPAEDHISLQRNGVVDHGGPDNLVGPIVLANLENGAIHPTIIRWNKATNNLKVFLDGVLRIDFTGNIISTIFGGDAQVFWGFTGATGAAVNNQTVCITNVVMKVEAPYTITQPRCPNTSDGAIDLAIVGGASPYTFLWSTGSTSEDLGGIPSGTYTVTVTDRNGCRSRYTMTLTGTDVTSPSIACPSNLPKNTDLNQCSAKVVYTAPIGTDNCPGSTTVQANGLPSGALFPKGVTINLFRVTDVVGRTATCTFTVTVTDNQPPAITCPADKTEKTDLNLCSAKVTYTAPVGTDNCPGHNTVQNSGLPSGSAFPTGTTTNVFTVTDASGLTAVCQFTVTVEDKQAPAITCPPAVTRACDASTAPNMTGLPMVSDNCGAGMPMHSDSITAGSCPGNFTITRTWSVSDIQGNGSTCNQTIKVQDIVAPAIICPPAVTVTCEIGPDAVTGVATAVDNCDPAPGISHSDRISGGDCNLLCSIERSWVAKDNCGNTAKCVQKVTKDVLPLLEAALNKDVNGDGVPDGILLGVSNSTLEIPPGRGACIQGWLPGTGTIPSGLKFTNAVVGSDCLPGTNPVDARRRLANPLLAEALVANIRLRLEPSFGTTPLSSFNCVAPIILQALAPNPDIRELLRVTNFALGNIALQPHLKELLAALKCVNGGPLDVCK